MSNPEAHTDNPQDISDAVVLAFRDIEFVEQDPSLAPWETPDDREVVIVGYREKLKSGYDTNRAQMVDIYCIEIDLEAINDSITQKIVFAIWNDGFTLAFDIGNNLFDERIYSEENEGFIVIPDSTLSKVDVKQYLKLALAAVTSI